MKQGAAAFTLVCSVFLSIAATFYSASLYINHDVAGYLALSQRFLGETRLYVDTLVPIRRRDDGSANFKYYIRACEVALIRTALTKTENNQTKAAEHLKISRHSLVYKIREYHIYDSAPSAEEP